MTAAEDLRREEVMVRLPRPDVGRSPFLSLPAPGGGLGGRDVKGILGRDGVFVFTLQGEQEEKKTTRKKMIESCKPCYARTVKKKKIKRFKISCYKIYHQ